MTAWGAVANSCWIVVPAWCKSTVVLPPSTRRERETCAESNNVLRQVPLRDFGVIRLRNAPNHEYHAATYAFARLSRLFLDRGVAEPRLLESGALLRGHFGSVGVPTRLSTWKICCGLTGRPGTL